MSFFGDTDPIDDLLSEAEQQADDEDRLPREDEWKYAFEPTGTDKKSGREMYTYGPDGDVYTGEEVRQMFEARRFDREGYTWFGYTKDPNRGVEEVGIPFDSLFKHVCLFGQSGYGKSTVMRNLLFQWIQADHGVCFIDPKGDDSPKLVKMMPEHRRDDLVWVEPGNTDYNSVIGFNFFDTYAEPGDDEYISECEMVAEQFVSLLSVFSNGFTSKMSGTAKSIVEQLVKAEEDYTPVDFYKILNDTAERDAFLELYGDEMEDIARDYVENFEPAEMGPLVNKVEEIVSKPALRELIAHEDSKISLAEIVEEGKVLLVNVSGLSEDVQLVAAAFVRRIWSTVQARSGNIPEDERRPFYLALDEFKDLCKMLPDQPNQLEIGEIFSKARSLKLSVMVATQQPSQLPEDIKEAVYKAENLFTFNTGDWNDAGDIAKGIGDIDMHAITNLGAYKILGRVTIENQTTDGLLVHTFPEYPPLRHDEMELIEESLERYGSPRTGGTGSMDNYGVERYLGNQEAKSVVVEGTEISPAHVLAAVASTQARQSTDSFQGHDDWVAREDIRAVFTRHTPDVPYDAIESDIVRPLTGSHLDRVERNGNEFFRLTDSGEHSIFTGAHRGEDERLALSGLRHISSLGLQTTLPLNDEDAVYFSAQGEPPIKPTHDADTMAKAQTLHMALESSYPEIAKHFRDSTVLMAANADPAERPREFATALATRKSRHVVFVIPEAFPADSPAPEGSTPHSYVANLLTYNKTPAFVKNVGEDGNRAFYNTQRPVDLENGTFALVNEPDLAWVEHGDALKLVGRSGKVHASFDDLRALQHADDPERFPFHCEPDSDGGWVVKEEVDQPQTDEDGDIITTEDGEMVMTNAGATQRFDSLAAIEDAGYTMVHEPLIPESILPSPTPDPDSDSWTLVIVPDAGDPYIFDPDAAETNDGTASIPDISEPEPEEDEEDTDDGGFDWQESHDEAEPDDGEEDTADDDDDDDDVGTDPFTTV